MKLRRVAVDYELSLCEFFASDIYKYYKEIAFMIGMIIDTESLKRLSSNCRAITRKNQLTCQSLSKTVDHSDGTKERKLKIKERIFHGFIISCTLYEGESVEIVQGFSFANGRVSSFRF